MKTDKKEGEVSTFDVCKAYMMVYFLTTYINFINLQKWKTKWQETILIVWTPGFYNNLYVDLYTEC